MCQMLYKWTDHVSFGNSDLVSFLVDHGAEFMNPALSVPLRAFRLALEHADELRLSEADRDFIKQEMSHPIGDEDDEGDQEVDQYGVA